MPKNDGEITKERILEVAEDLFSKNGFDATSMDSISKIVGINKATIYYHFSGKNDIIVSLFAKILMELEVRVKQNSQPSDNIIDKINKEIEYLKSKRRILSVMMMEALKEKHYNNTLFQCMEKVIKNELKELNIIEDSIEKKKKQKYYIHEFFTGIMPVLTYVIFEKKWNDFFGFDQDSIQSDFIEIFRDSHLNTHKL